MSFFGVGANPFQTPIGMKIEKATSENLPSEDWGLNMEICDLIKHSEEGPRDAMKAIRKRLTTQPKNFTVVLYTLTVLESCVKNCGKRFQVIACSKDFVQELVKLIGPKNDPPVAIQEKVLSMIQSWATAFCHQPELAGVSQVYADLKHKKVEFPPVSADAATTIYSSASRSRSIDTDSHSPAVSISPSRRQHPQQSERFVIDSRSPNERFIVDSSTSVSGPNPSSNSLLTPEQKAKLRSELDLVESNGKVLAEMLNELTPGKEQPDDLQLLQDLHATCKTMQERVVELVGRISDDLLTADLLRINDDMNNLFVRYDRHVSKNKVISTGVPQVPVATSIAPTATVVSNSGTTTTSTKEDDAPLIDLGGEESAIEELATLCIGKKPEDADFDVFAQSRTSSDPKPCDLLASGAESLLVQDQKPSDFDEMEEWLKSQPGNDTSKSSPRIPEESLSSSDFEKFLAERAAAADNLPTVESADDVPTIAAATGSTSMLTQVATARTRTLQKDDQNEKQLFSL